MHAPDTFLDVHVAQFSRQGQSLFLIFAYGTSTARTEHMLEVLDEVRHQPSSAGDIGRARRRYTVDMLRGLHDLDARAARIVEPPNPAGATR